jgi:hypothetical protein
MNEYVVKFVACIVQDHSLFSGDAVRVCSLSRGLAYIELYTCVIFLFASRLDFSFL